MDGVPSQIIHSGNMVTMPLSYQRVRKSRNNNNYLEEGANYTQQNDFRLQAPISLEQQLNLSHYDEYTLKKGTVG